MNEKMDSPSKKRPANQVADGSDATRVVEAEVQVALADGNMEGDVADTIDFIGSVSGLPPHADEAGKSDRVNLGQSYWQPMEPKPISALHKGYPSPKVATKEMN